jgi:2-polyprenyl-6-hydroxyphenyl methylase/3-demethylubiquinone-9 3-methyltransferase
MTAAPDESRAAARGEARTDPFVAYYKDQSAAPGTVAHFQRLRDLLLRALPAAPDGRPIRVADIGCGAGTFSRIWAQAGCEVDGIDVNRGLVEVAIERANAERLPLRFFTGSAESLPWPDGRYDVVVMPELLEHVPQWQACLAEAVRVLGRGGILYLSTTNRLCPVQQEFQLPLYSWYPAPLKRRCLRLAMSTRREWVNHAQFPAVNWFDPYRLASSLRKLGLVPADRFQMLARHADSPRKRRLAGLIAALPPARFLGHVLSSGTIVLGRKP